MDTEISYHNNDILMKVLAERFRDKTLDALGIQSARIKNLLPTVNPVVEANERRNDIIFLLEDGTLLHLEFQTTESEQDLIRFLSCDVRLIRQQKRQVRTAVIYAGRIIQALTRLEYGSVCYQVENIYMGSYDGDKEYNRLKDKLKQGKALSEEDTLKLILLPLMKSREKEENLTIQAAELAKSADRETKIFVLAALIVLSDKIMSEGNKRKLLEVLKMTEIEQWIKEEGRQEGRMEGGREEKKRTALNMLKLGMAPEVIAKVTELSPEEIQVLARKSKN